MIREISRKLFFVQRGWLNANHFVFNGRRKVLIDTGYITGFDETRKWIETAGVNLRAIDFIVSTHSHCDHIGGNKKIQEISECQIAIHRIDKGSIDSRDDWATWYRFYDQEAEFFPVDIALEEGETVNLDELKLRVIHTPGHARGGICLYCPEGRFLISSDALWDGDLGVLNTIVEGWDAPLLAMQSLEKLSSLKIDIAYPGHGDIVFHPQAAIDKCKKKLEDFIKNPTRLGNDHLKKILIWTLLMKNGHPREGFLRYLMAGHWFPSVVDAFFEGRYHEKFDELMEEFLRRKIIYIADGYYRTVVEP